MELSKPTAEISSQSHKFVSQRMLAGMNSQPDIIIKNRIYMHKEEKQINDVNTSASLKSKCTQYYAR